MEYVNLEKMTEVELLMLSVRVSEEINKYNNRDKIKVFRLMVFGNAYYYSTSERLLKELDSYISEYDLEEMILEEKIELCTDYMSKADFDKFVKE